MADRESLLTDNERTALDVHEALPRARAIDAWLTYAALQNFDATQVTNGAEEIRAMSLEQLKRVRKDLAAAARLLDLMTSARSLGLSELVDEPEVRAPEESAIESDGEIASAADSQPEPDSLDEKSRRESVEVTEPNPLSDAKESGLSTSGRAWLLELFPDYELGDSDDTQPGRIAADLYARMGSPETRLNKGKKIDPVARITKRLAGMTNAEIAESEQVSPESVGMWFRNFVEKKLVPAKVNQQTAELLPEPEPEPEPEPAVTSEPRFERPLDEEPMFVQLTERIDKVVGFMDGEKVAFKGLIDPHNKGIVTSPKLRAAKRFREKLEELGPLPDTLRQLEPAEKIRICRLLGIKLSGDRIVDEPVFQLTDQMEQARRGGLEPNDIAASLHQGLAELIGMIEASGANANIRELAKTIKQVELVNGRPVIR